MCCKELRHYEQTWIDRHQSWTARAMLGLGMLTLISGIANQQAMLFLASGLYFWYAGLLFWLRRQFLQRARLARRVAAGALLGITALGTIYAPQALPALLLLPLMTVATAMPLIDLRLLQRYALAAWLVTVGTLVGVQYRTALIDLSPVSNMALILAVAAIIALLLRILYSYHEQLTLLFQQSRASTGELSRLRDDLAAQVAASTTQLLASREHFRLMFEHSPLGIFLLHPDGRFAAVNPAFAQLLGYPPETLTRQTLADVADPADCALVTGPGSPLHTASNDNRQLEVQLYSRERRQIWVNVSTALLTDHPEYGQVLLGVCEPITARKQSEAALRASEARLRLVAEHIDEVFWLIAPDGSRVSYVSPGYERIFGRSCSELYAAPASWLLALHPQDRSQITALTATSRGAAYEATFRVVHPDGTIHWIWLSEKPISDSNGNLVQIVGVAKDISEQKAHEDEIVRMAYTDALTNLPNRRALADLLDNVQNAASVALLYLDLDRFKAVNDSLGHDIGDELLVQVGARLSTTIRTGDTLARLGGDEFAVFLPDATVEQAIAVARRMLNEIRRPFELRRQTVHIGGSIGVAFGTAEHISFSPLLTHADIAMYQAKASGGGMQIYNAALSAEVQNRVQLEGEFRHALESDGLRLYYQPIVDLQSNKPVIHEILVRWPHPTRGMLSAQVFVPLAEEVGLGGQLDRWVLHMAMAELARHNEPESVGAIAVNLTASSLQDRELVSEVARLLVSHEVQAQQLVLEVTEHTALRDLSAAGEVLTGLRNLGVRIALDDFGSGYASLGYLQRLPIDILKIDRAFVNGIGRELREETLLRTLLALGRGLGLQVIVEGVEDEAQLDWLRDAGATHVQGYLLGRPAPREKSEMLAQSEYAVTPAQRRLVLVVDDSEDNRAILYRILRLYDYDVTLATNGRQALEIAAVRRPDIILMDLTMPEMDGWTATALFKSTPQLARIPIVAVTGYITGEHRERALRAGCSAYVPKPFNIEDLLQVIATELDRATALGA